MGLRLEVESALAELRRVAPSDGAFAAAVARAKHRNATTLMSTTEAIYEQVRALEARP